jgi:voltage-gated potassium channel
MTTLGRFVTAFTILIGISATSFLSGTLASVFVERNTRARRGLMDFKKLKNHVIVCGWKDNMKDILLDIINLSDGIASEDIVIISNVEPDKASHVRSLQSFRACVSCGAITSRTPR